MTTDNGNPKDVPKSPLVPGRDTTAPAATDNAQRRAGADQRQARRNRSASPDSRRTSTDSDLSRASTPSQPLAPAIPPAAVTAIPVRRVRFADDPSSPPDSPPLPFLSTAAISPSATDSQRPSFVSMGRSKVPLEFSTDPTADDSSSDLDEAEDDGYASEPESEDEGISDEWGSPGSTHEDSDDSPTENWGARFTGVRNGLKTLRKQDDLNDHVKVADSDHLNEQQCQKKI